MADVAPRWNRLERDERRSQILAVAAQLFSERHYASVSTKDIADAAGVARGLLHHYFGSKRDLYLEVTREMLRVPALPLLADPTATADELWASSVDGWLDLMEANRETWLSVTRAGETGHDPQLREILDEASELVVERVLQALGLDGDDVPSELRAVVRAYGGLAQEATREWLERGRLERAQVRILLVGVMPLIASELLPDILKAGRKPKKRSGRS
jgi:AcrR family transcriptional regulator